MAYGLVSVSHHWNNFLWPPIITNSVESRPLTVGLQVFSSTDQGIDWSVITAATLLSAAPLLVGFLLFQRQFVQSFMRAGDTLKEDGCLSPGWSMGACPGRGQAPIQPAEPVPCGHRLPKVCRSQSPAGTGSRVWLMAYHQPGQIHHDAGLARASAACSANSRLSLASPDRVS